MRVVSCGCGRQFLNNSFFLLATQQSRSLCDEKKRLTVSSADSGRKMDRAREGVGKLTEEREREERGKKKN